MEEKPEYGKIAAMIDAASASSGQATAPIDISEVFANRLETRKLKYADLESVLERVEVKKAEKPVIAPEVQIQVPQQAKAQVRIERPQAPKKETVKETESAAKRLRELVGRAGREFEESVERELEKREEEKLVMPKLSPQDQLADLEKIGEGIDEGVFDQEHMRIIVEEVNALSSISTREDVSRFSEGQREIVAMRNAKIKEIKDRLNIG